MTSTTATPASPAHESLLASLGVNAQARRPARRPAPPYDPVKPFVDELVTNPHLLMLGQPATGKSAAAKCLARRLLGSASQGCRQLGVVDPKGEYGPLAEALGLRLARLCPGGPDRLNPLDAGPLGHRRDAQDVVERRMAVVVALCEMKLRRPLSPVERWAVEAAVNELDVSWTGPQPVLADVAELLGNPTAEMTEWAEAAPSFESAGVDRPVDVAVDATHVRHALARVLDHELRGTFDGASTVRADGAGAGVVIDVSSFHARGPAAAFAALAACTWLEAATAAAEEPGGFPRRYNVVDEAHVVMCDEQASTYLAAWLERSTLDGVATIVIAHRLDDLRWGGADGHTIARRAAAFAERFGTRAVFRQSIDQSTLSASALGLASGEGTAVPCLRRGQALWKVGGAGFVVDHDIAADEWGLVTDPRHGAVRPSATRPPRREA